MFDNKKIIFVHGLASKPKKEITHKFWSKCLIESLQVKNPDIFAGAGKTEIDNIFHSAYWANAVPSHLEDEDAYVSKLKKCVSKVIKERKDKGEDFHVGLGGKFKAFFKNRGLDVADMFMTALTLKDNVTEHYLEEVNLYTNDQYIADKIRRPLEDALKAAWDANKKVAIISHSMGTFITYDVLWRFSRRSEFEEYQQKKVQYLVTMGSPLGNGVIKDLLFASRYEDEESLRRFPNNVEKWHNFSCLGDVVSHDGELKDDFMDQMEAEKLLPKESSRDYSQLYNPFITPAKKANPHKSYGYLVQPKLAKWIEDFLKA